MVNKKEIIEILIIPLLVLFSYLLSFYGLGGEGGFTRETYLQKVTFYFPALITGGFILFVFALFKLFVKGNAFLKETFVHDPENSMFSKILPLKFYNSVPKMILLSILFFSTLAFFVILQNNITFTQTGLIEQQVTKTGEVIGSAYPVADAETLIIESYLMVLLGVVGIFSSKKNKDIKGILIFLVILLVGLTWAIFHTQAYGNDQVAFGLTFLFGFTGAGLTYLTRSIIPFIVWHQIHNIFAKVREIFADQTIIISLTIFYILIIILYIRLLRGKKE